MPGIGLDLDMDSYLRLRTLAERAGVSEPEQARRLIAQAVADVPPAEPPAKGESLWDAVQKAKAKHPDATLDDDLIFDGTDITRRRIQKRVRRLQDRLGPGHRVP